MHEDKEGRVDRSGPQEDYGLGLVTESPPAASSVRLSGKQQLGELAAQHLMLHGIGAGTEAEPWERQQPARVYYNLDGWTVEYLVVPENGSPVIAALIIHPGDIDDATERRPVPRDGINARLLRRLHPANARRFARSELAQYAQPENPLTDAIALHGYREPDLKAERRPGRPSRPDRFYAELAAKYVTALDAGSKRPIEDAAKQSHYSPAYVRDAISKARRRELLTRTERGRAGGQLTAEGRRALETGETAGDGPAITRLRQPCPEWRKLDVHYVPPAKRETSTHARSKLDREIDRKLCIE